MRGQWMALSVLLGMAAAVQAADFEATVALGWESEYIFRGQQYADGIVVPSVEMSYGDAYANIWAAIPEESKDSNEIDYTAGYGFDVGEILTVDAGITYYTYPEDQDDFFDRDVNTVELYAGVACELPLEPSLYVYYDLDLETLTVEASASYEWEIAENLSLAPSLSAGYVDIRDSENYVGEDGDQDGYFYGQASADLTYCFTDDLSATAGVRFSASSEDGLYDGDDSTFWYGATLAWSFGAGEDTDEE